MERPSSDESKSLKVIEIILQAFKIKFTLISRFFTLKVELGISIQQIIDVVLTLLNVEFIFFFLFLEHLRFRTKKNKQ